VKFGRQTSDTFSHLRCRLQSREPDCSYARHGVSTTTLFNSSIGSFRAIFCIGLTKRRRHVRQYLTEARTCYRSRLYSEPWGRDDSVSQYAPST